MFADSNEEEIPKWLSQIRIDEAVITVTAKSFSIIIGTCASGLSGLIPID